MSTNETMRELSVIELVGVAGGFTTGCGSGGYHVNSFMGNGSGCMYPKAYNAPNNWDFVADNPQD